MSPLHKGKSNKAVSANIRELIRHDHPKAQAVAIALRVAGKAQKRPQRKGK